MNKWISFISFMHLAFMHLATQFYVLLKNLMILYLWIYCIQTVFPTLHIAPRSKNWQVQICTDAMLPLMIPYERFFLTIAGRVHGSTGNRWTCLIFTKFLILERGISCGKIVEARMLWFVRSPTPWFLWRDVFISTVVLVCVFLNNCHDYLTNIIPFIFT